MHTERLLSLLQWRQSSSSNCRVTVVVCGFTAGRQDNWLITQHISRMVNSTALQQVTVQVDFIMNTCDVDNNCRRSFAIHKYETSTINTTAARNLSKYEFVDQIVPRDGSGSVRENGSVNINFATEATGFYLGIQDETTCILINRVLVFYCDAGTYGRGGTCLPCPANSNSTQSGESVCPCFERYYRAAGEPPEMACTRKSFVAVLSWYQYT